MKQTNKTGTEQTPKFWFWANITCYYCNPSVPFVTLWADYSLEALVQEFPTSALLHYGFYAYLPLPDGGFLPTPPSLDRQTDRLDTGLLVVVLPPLPAPDCLPLTTPPVACPLHHPPAFPYPSPTPTPPVVLLWFLSPSCWWACFTWHGWMQVVAPTCPPQTFGSPSPVYLPLYYHPPLPPPHLFIVPLPS